MIKAGSHPDGHGHDRPRPDPASGAAGHEISDVSLRPLLLFVAGLVAAGVVVFLGLGGLMQLYAARESPNAGLSSTLPPPIRDGVAAPPLQAAPHDDLIEMRREERAILQGASETDPKAGRARIPLEDAMRLVLERGLPTRPSPDTTSGAAPGEAEEAEPTASASGRRPGASGRSR